MTVAPPRGMRDFLPAQVSLRDWATSVILSTYQRFGFTRIETPVLENIDLLRGGEGGENLQLIYEVLKRGEKLQKALSANETVNSDDLSDLGLRFDLTVPLVRYYSSNQSQLPHPLKSIQIGSVFRAESPQKGRFRQFTQCDIDIIGVKSELAEMELIQATSTALLALGFEKFKIHINDRRLLTALGQFCGFGAEELPKVFIALDKLDKIGLDAVLLELKTDNAKSESVENLRLMLQAFCSVRDGSTSFQDFRESLPILSDEFMGPLEKVIAAITEISKGRFDIIFDPTLVRGMGYYTGQIFEVKSQGYGSSIAGGGRYDKMVGKLSGRDVPACGFSIGFERMIDILSEKGFKPLAKENTVALIVDPESDSGAGLLKAANKLRRDGTIVSVQPRKKDLKKQLDALLTQGYSHYCVFKGADAELDLKILGAHE